MILSDGTTELVLPDALAWTDEAWSPERVSVERSLTGALILQSATLLGGRPITLASPAPDTGVVPWETRQTLLAWTQVPDLEMTLNLADGTEHTVAFRYEGDTSPLSFVGLGELPGRRGPGTWWSLTLRLIEVPQ